MSQIEKEQIDSSPFCKQTLQLKVSLLPSSLRDVRCSIEKNINQMLFTYNSTCQGVLLAYDDLKILDQGKILNEFPHIHYRLVSLVYLLVRECCRGFQLNSQKTKNRVCRDFFVFFSFPNDLYRQTAFLLQR